MVKQREFLFQRDKTPHLDYLSKVLDNILIVGDIVVPYLCMNVVDEVRFYNKELTFIQSGEKKSYKYSRVKAEVISTTAQDSKLENIQIRFTTDDGGVFNLDLYKQNMCPCGGTRFSKNRKDFLYRLAKHMPRLKEKKQVKKLPYLKLVLLGLFLLIVLAP